MEKTEEFKAKRMVKVVGLQDTSDERFLYEKGKVYDLPEDHPCMQYFEPATYTTDPADLGPPGVVLKKGAKISEPKQLGPEGIELVEEDGEKWTK